MNTVFMRVPCGGDKRDRTADLLNAIQALSQLSYTPVFTCLSLDDEMYSSISQWKMQEEF